ncbi:stage II sporulation protein M [Paenibacillus sp. P22]|uniref:stage II sporulation protein M n=1 Tax=Paenibacillus TaxID=44249 RepID=UPI0003FF159A|nr:stage II sporulation protein M [Paenibacillus sp. P22]
MEITAFIRRNKSQWSELDGLLTLLGGRGKRAPAGQLDRFHELYRSASSHLAYLQTHAPGSEAEASLNDLVSRAHNTMHGAGEGNSRLGSFFRTGFPHLVRQRGWFIGAATLLFLLGGLLGYLSVWQDPMAVHSVLPAGMSDVIDPSKTNSDRGDVHSPIMSTTIMTNNIRVAVMAFLSGITLGIGTVYLMVYNGLMIGALAAVFAREGYSYTFWAYILPHGIIELTAIFIAGGAGLYMGYRFFVPGELPRKLVFLQAAKESALLLIGSVPLFVVAGLIEGYITPVYMPLWIKYAVALLTLAVLAAYYVLGTIRMRPAPAIPNTR